jgi:pyridoxamine 5'-phosphate oxidase
VSDDRLARLRIEYADEGLDEAAAGSDPTVLFLQWLDEAIASGMHEPNAMTLSTLGIGGAPSARIVLLKHADPSGLVFYTNYLSRKSREIGANPHCALTFPWHPLERQLRVEGTASQVPPEESDGYFALRPRAAQLGAWASPQSQVVRDRGELDAIYAEVEARFPEPAAVPRPPHWGGWRVAPRVYEFWQGRRGRMHDRIRFTADGGGWVRERLAP